jgi:glycosyltransferase 2 family protein
VKVSKAHILQFIKIGLAFGIVFYLLRSGRLSLEHLSEFVSRPVFFISALLMMAVFYLVNFYRWKLILSLVEIDISFWISVRLSMLGQFFSTFMPGAVGGDLVKAVYVARRYPTRRTQSVMTILLDRVVGLFALIIWGALGFFLGRSHFDLSPHPLGSVAQAAGWSLVLCAILGIAGFIWVTFLPKGISPEPPNFFKKLPMSKRWITFYELVLSFQRRPLTAWMALGLALFVQALNLSVLIVIAWSLFGAPPWGLVHVDTFVAASCLGLCLMALPLAPLGLGVGQAAFATMFAILGVSDMAFGASIVTGYQLLSLILNLTGLYYYVSYRHEVEP